MRARYQLTLVANRCHPAITQQQKGMKVVQHFCLDRLPKKGNYGLRGLVQQLTEKSMPLSSKSRSALRSQVQPCTAVVQSSCRRGWLFIGPKAAFTKACKRHEGLKEACQGPQYSTLLFMIGPKPQTAYCIALDVWTCHPCSAVSCRCSLLRVDPVPCQLVGMPIGTCAQI